MATTRFTNWVKPKIVHGKPTRIVHLIRENIVYYPMPYKDKEKRNECSRRYHHSPKGQITHKSWYDRKMQDPKWKEKKNQNSRDWNNKNKERHNHTKILHNWRKRLAVIKKMGGKCCVTNCKIDDPRILEINHIASSRNIRNDHKFHYRFMTEILNNQVDMSTIELRCANHNILYEYEIGRRQFPIEEIQKVDKTAY